MMDDKEPLKELLRTGEGCAFVAAELMIALENLGMVSPDMLSLPEKTVQEADLVCHVVKSRETKEGWFCLKYPRAG